MRWMVISCLLMLVAACDAPTTGGGATARPGFNPDAAARNFVQVIQRVEPVAERECRARTRRNCDFKIVVDDRPGQQPNAFQTEDRSGRPVIAFTISLIADARSQDELAFILGHEAAHHIAGHLRSSRQNASIGAQILGSAVQASGGSNAQVEAAARVGAQVGVLRYSQRFELEADSLGAVITRRAGFDPVKGAKFFDRIPDPGNSFLNTHPPTAQRQATVRKVDAQLRGAQ
ncbi:M48 family metallopeptidase [Actibacterium sp. 188UL27-1]|uniref:M48 family metallopeptidase n=1 Tax=Actibacterium sp. 188UL27-1 TaxID=2786961 RepID=UPI001959A2D2|nr:M48 family metallopeptidase [Actibacterium sp. 188UL27-1]MBM7068736.1 M48 family metallopeptidase [Actibacterium sp. 188UL27-1]